MKEVLRMSALTLYFNLEKKIAIYILIYNTCLEDVYL